MQSNGMETYVLAIVTATQIGTFLFRSGQQEERVAWSALQVVDEDSAPLVDKGYTPAATFESGKGGRSHTRANPLTKLSVSFEGKAPGLKPTNKSGKRNKNKGKSPAPPPAVTEADDVLMASADSDGGDGDGPELKGQNVASAPQQDMDPPAGEPPKDKSPIVASVAQSEVSMVNDDAAAGDRAGVAEPVEAKAEEVDAKREHAASDDDMDMDFTDDGLKVQHDPDLAEEEFCLKLSQTVGHRGEFSDGVTWSENVRDWMKSVEGADGYCLGYSIEGRGPRQQHIVFVTRAQRDEVLEAMHSNSVARRKYHVEVSRCWLLDQPGEAGAPCGGRIMDDQHYVRFVGPANSDRVRKNTILLAIEGNEDLSDDLDQVVEKRFPTCIWVQAHFKTKEATMRAVRWAVGQKLGVVQAERWAKVCIGCEGQGHLHTECPGSMGELRVHFAKPNYTVREYIAGKLKATIKRSEALFMDLDMGGCSRTEGNLRVRSARSDAKVQGAVTKFSRTAASYVRSTCERCGEPTGGKHQGSDTCHVGRPRRWVAPEPGKGKKTPEEKRADLLEYDAAFRMGHPAWRRAGYCLYFMWNAICMKGIEGGECKWAHPGGGKSGVLPADAGWIPGKICPPAFVGQACDDIESCRLSNDHRPGPALALLGVEGAKQRVIDTLVQHGYTRELAILQLEGDRDRRNIQAGRAKRVRDNSCFNWKETGRCKWADNCRFEHSEQKQAPQEEPRR